MKRNKCISLVLWSIGVVLIILFSPLAVAGGTSAPVLQWATNDNDWIGFWGDYIGAVLGGLITLYVLYRTLRSERKNHRREEKVAFFDKLLDLQDDWCHEVSNLFAYLVITINEIGNYEKNNPEMQKLLRKINEDTKERNMPKDVIVKMVKEESLKARKNSNIGETKEDWERVQLINSAMMKSFKIKSYLQIWEQEYDLQAIRAEYEILDKCIDAVYKSIKETIKERFIEKQEAEELTTSINEILLEKIPAYLDTYGELASKALKETNGRKRCCFFSDL